jgi:hypothetical protein
MTREEKQDLFIKKLYLLSHKHIDETSEERLADVKLPPITSVASPDEPVTNDEPSPTPIATFKSLVTQLSGLTFACSGMTYLFTDQDTETPAQENMDYFCAKDNESTKRDFRALVKKADIPIPTEIALMPTDRNVSRLEDDDISLARQIAAVSKSHELAPTPRPIHHDAPYPIDEDDGSRHSPQCIGDRRLASYEMKISRIIAANPDAALRSGEMEI